MIKYLDQMNLHHNRVKYMRKTESWDPITELDENAPPEYKCPITQKFNHQVLVVHFLYSKSLTFAAFISQNII